MLMSTQSVLLGVEIELLGRVAQWVKGWYLKLEGYLERKSCRLSAAAF